MKESFCRCRPERQAREEVCLRRPRQLLPGGHRTDAERGHEERRTRVDVVAEGGARPQDVAQVHLRDAATADRERGPRAQAGPGQPPSDDRLDLRPLGSQGRFQVRFGFAFSKALRWIPSPGLSLTFLILVDQGVVQLDQLM